MLSKEDMELTELHLFAKVKNHPIQRKRGRGAEVGDCTPVLSDGGVECLEKVFLHLCCSMVRRRKSTL